MGEDVGLDELGLDEVGRLLGVFDAGVALEGSELVGMEEGVELLGLEDG